MLCPQHQNRDRPASQHHAIVLTCSHPCTRRCFSHSSNSRAEPPRCAHAAHSPACTGTLRPHDTPSPQRVELTSREPLTCLRRPAHAHTIPASASDDITVNRHPVHHVPPLNPTSLTHSAVQPKHGDNHRQSTHRVRLAPIPIQRLRQPSAPACAVKVPLYRSPPLILCGGHRHECQNSSRGPPRPPPRPRPHAWSADSPWNTSPAVAG